MIPLAIIGAILAGWQLTRPGLASFAIIVLAIILMTPLAAHLIERSYPHE